MLKKLFGSVLIVVLLLLTILPLSVVNASNYGAVTDWYSDSVYGIGAPCPPNSAASLYGRSYNDTINNFDVDRVAELCELTGAKFYQLSATSSQSFLCAPNSVFDSYTGYSAGQKCATRDLISDLYDVLNPIGVKLVVYLVGDLGCNDAQAGSGLGWDGTASSSTYRQRLKEVYKCWSDRYGTKVAGWWVDCCWLNPYTGWTDANLQDLSSAIKSGNPNSIVTFNRGINYDAYIRSTSAEDFSSGEVNEIGTLSGPLAPSRWINGLQWQTWLTLGHEYGSHGVRYSTKDLINYMKSVKDNKGVVTFDMTSNTYWGDNPDYNQLEALKEVKSAIRDGIEPLYPRLVDNSDARISYSGTTSRASDEYCYNGSELQLSAGAYAEYTFTGKTIKWIGSKDIDFGDADVYIDNTLITSGIDCYQAPTYFSESKYRQQTLFWYTWPTSGTHTIKVYSNSKVSVDAFEVNQTNQTIYDDRDSAITYSGNWSNTDDGLAISGTEKYSNGVGAYAQMSFTGTYVKVWGEQNNNLGYARIYIDGVQQTPDVNLYSYSKLNKQCIFSKRGLPSGSHTIKIEVMNKTDWWSSGTGLKLDAVEVINETQSVVSTPLSHTTVNDSDPAITYSSGWNVDSSIPNGKIGSEDRYTNGTNNYAQYTFEGKEIWCVGTRFSNRGYADIYIDGNYDRTVDMYSSHIQEQAVVYKKTGLSAGLHTIKVVCKGTKNANSSDTFIAIDAFKYAATGGQTETQFSDTFSAGSSNWTANSGSWGVENGEYSQENMTSNLFNSTVTGKTWGNANYEVDIKCINNNGNNTNWAALNIMKTNADDPLNSGYLIYVRSNGYVCVDKPGITIASVNKELDMTSFKHLKVITNNGNIKVYVNNESSPCIDINDSTYTSGYVSTATCLSHWHFDNVNIKAAYTPTLYDYIDAGDLTSENNHNMQRSAASGIGLEDGFTRRYGGYHSSGTWLSYDVSVPANTDTINLLVRETSTGTLLRDYKIYIDGVLLEHYSNTYSRTAIYSRNISDLSSYTADGKLVIEFREEDPWQNYEMSITDIWVTN